RYDPDALRQAEAELDALGRPDRRRVGDDEVGALRGERGEAGVAQAPAQEVAALRQPGGQLPVVCRREAEGDGGGVLERRRTGVGEVLLGRADGGDELGRAAGPAHLPAGEGERLAVAGDRDRALRHTGEGGQRDVPGAVVDEVLVDLVG